MRKETFELQFEGTATVEELGHFIRSLEWLLTIRIALEMMRPGRPYSFKGVLSPAALNYDQLSLIAKRLRRAPPHVKRALKKRTKTPDHVSIIAAHILDSKSDLIHGGPIGFVGSIHIKAIERVNPLLLIATALGIVGWLTTLALVGGKYMRTSDQVVQNNAITLEMKREILRRFREGLPVDRELLDFVLKSSEDIETPDLSIIGSSLKAVVKN